MKVIIMAAGRGTRISKDIEKIPKCTLPLGRVSLIRNTINLFLENSIDVCLVVGYQKNHILKEVDDLPIEIVYNPFYQFTNSIASLWFAKEFLTDDEIILINGDVYIEQDTIDLLLAEKASPVMLADSRKVDEGDFFFKYNNHILQDYGKDLKKHMRTGEYVGIAKISSSFVDVFRNTLNSMIESERYNDWWENVLYHLSDHGKNVYITDIGDRYWSEIDKIEDYYKIRDYINKTVVK
ncbi:phosphocholine cytidylyltransferase family protein [Evansella halocellulosilytica]|uniref:phosphocholine cytidylyltransferase family protein n=1 Tax=Evansella halocellulosilytica TaxID=2011013 RepID=UPI000BB91C14|nr:phosphocholine cytidylyltransferase family protein [Evansella halocellulosilytica]